MSKRLEMDLPINFKNGASIDGEFKVNGKNITVDTKAPTNPKKGDVWIDISDEITSDEIKSDEITNKEV